MCSIARNSLTLALALAATAAARADIVGLSDTSFFTSHPSTLIDFETDGAGNPISLLDGQTQAMPGNAYAAQGITFVGGPAWVNDGSPLFDAAQAIGGSGDISIPSAAVNSFTITFNATTRSVGFWVISNSSVAGNIPAIAAYGPGNVLLGTVQFAGAYIDGTLTAGATTVGYGFMGLSSSTPIDHIIVTKQAAIFDDLRFSAVPTPGAAALLACGGAMMIRRRKR